MRERDLTNKIKGICCKKKKRTPLLFTCEFIHHNWIRSVNSIGHKNWWSIEISGVLYTNFINKSSIKSYRCNFFFHKRQINFKFFKKNYQDSILLQEKLTHFENFLPKLLSRSPIFVTFLCHRTETKGQTFQCKKRCVERKVLEIFFMVFYIDL